MSGRHRSATDFLRHWRTQLIDVSGGGTRLLLQSGESGTWQLAELSLLTGERIQLTRTSVTVRGRYLGDDRIAIETDQDGDQRYRISVRERSGELVPISVETAGRGCRLADVSVDGRLICFVTTSNDRRYTEVQVRDLGSGRQKLVYVGEGLIDSLKFAPDNRHLVGRSEGRGPMDRHMLLFDLARSSCTEVGYHQAAAFRGSPAWLPDSSGFLFTSNEDREFSALMHYDLAIGSPRLVSEASWDIVWAAPVDRVRGLIVRNEDGTDRLFRYEIGQPSAAVGLPEAGVVTTYVPDPILSRDRRYCFFTFTSPRESGDAWRYDLRESRFSRITQSGSISWVRSDSSISG